jgi:hypothetical protein
VVQARTDEVGTHRRRRRWWWILLIALVVLALVIGTVILLWPGRPRGNVQRPIRTLFAALANHDPTAATAAAGRAPMNAPPITAGYAAPTDLAFGKVTLDPSGMTPAAGHEAAFVDVTYRVGGRRVTERYTVQRPTAGPADTWAITSGGIVRYSVVSTLVPSALIGGTTVKAGGTGVTEAFVGQYRLELTANALLQPAPPGVIDLAPPAPVVVRLDAAVTLRPGAADSILRLVHSGLVSCARETHLVLSSPECGFSYRGPLDQAANVHWTIDAYPDMAVAISSNPATDGGQVVARTAKAGAATATYTAGGARHTIHAQINVRAVARLGPGGQAIVTEVPA